MSRTSVRWHRAASGIAKRRWGCEKSADRKRETTAFTFQEELKGHHELFNSCAVITDGRFSGGSSGLSIGYVSPEAALGGPLGVVKEGDEIEIDVINRRITLCISDEEMAKRISEFHWEFPASNYQRYLRLFVKNVGSMAQGCVWDC